MKANISKSLVLLFIALSVGCKEKVVEKEKLEESSYAVAIDSAKLLAQSLIDKYQTPGIAVSVSINGEIVWSEGLGYADLENQVEVDPSITKFRIGSVSKTYTAASLGLLYEEGKIDFDNLVQVYVPDFPEKKYPITVRQVAGHTAGIRHYKGNEFLSTKYYATVTVGLAIFENDSLLFEPDTDYSYSSYGWNLVSAIVEGASGESFLPYMDKVFNSLGMENSEADVASVDNPNRTTFYLVEDDSVKIAPYVDNSYKWAGGGFISTSEDLVQFGNAHLYNKYLKPETFEVLTTSHQLKDGSLTNYGIGWRSGVNDEGVKWVGHSGGSVGGITMFAIYPDDKIVVALCSNSSDHGWDGLHHILASLFAADQ